MRVTKGLFPPDGAGGDGSGCAVREAAELRRAKRCDPRRYMTNSDNVARLKAATKESLGHARLYEGLEVRHMKAENTIRQFLCDIGHGDIVVEWDKVRSGA